MKSQIGQWGNALAFRIPKAIVKELNFKLNDPVQCRVEDGNLIVKPMQKAKQYTLDELLDSEIELNEEVSWGKPEGIEAW